MGDDNEPLGSSEFIKGNKMNIVNVTISFFKYKTKVQRQI